MWDRGKLPKIWRPVWPPREAPDRGVTFADHSLSAHDCNNSELTRFVTQ